MPQLLHPLQETSLSCRIPYPQGTPDQVIFGHKAKQTRIGKIDRIVGSHPVIVLAEGIFSHRTAFHIECVSLHTGLLMLMTHNGIAEKHSIPGINFYRNLLAGVRQTDVFPERYGCRAEQQESGLPASGKPDRTRND